MFGCRRVIAATVSALAGVAFALPVAAPATAAPAVAGSSPGLILQTSDERGCTETAYFRSGLLSAVRPLVPERYALQEAPAPPGGAPRVRLLVNELVCTQVTTSGVRLPRPVTTVIVSAYTDTDLYVLFYATTNPVQWATLRAVGWPADLLYPQTAGTTHPDPAGGLTLTLHVVGSGWTHDLTATTTETPGVPETSTAGFVRDTRGHAWSLCYDNAFSPAVTSTLTADLTGTRLASVASIPPDLVDYPSYLAVGGQRSRLTTDQCP